MSCYKRGDGGPRDRNAFDYRVEITVPCPRGHALATFHRLTLPEFEHEGVMYDRRRMYATLTAADADWSQMDLGCPHCPRHVQVSRGRLERELAAMWAPLATRRERRPWDAPR